MGTVAKCQRASVSGRPMAEPSPLVVRLAPGFMRALVRICLPHELIVALGPAMEGLDWSFDAAAGLLRERMGRKEATQRAKALVESQISGVLAALSAEGLTVESEQAKVAVGLLDTAVNRVGALRSDILVKTELSVDSLRGRLRDAIADELKAEDGPVSAATERLLAAAAESLIQTASTRDQFLEQAIAALLQRSRRIEGATSELPGMYAYLRRAVPTAAERDAAYREVFLRAVARRTANMRLLALPDDSVPVEEAVFATATMDRGSEQMPALLARNGRLLLIGAAGAGKSTRLVSLVRRLALGRSDVPEQLRGRTPFFFPLRGFGDRNFPTPRGLTQLSAPNFADDAPAGWASRVFEQGAVLACDGLDELPRGRRRDFFAWLKSLSRDFEHGVGLSVIVSTRPSAICGAGGERLAATREWPTAQLDALDENARDHLLRSYCGWLGAAGLAGASTRGDAIVQMVRQNPGLSSLAQNPLMACLVARAEHGEGLSDRANLCLAGVRTLLGRPIVDDLPLDGAGRIELLGALAAWFQENAYVVASISDVEAFLPATRHGSILPPPQLREALVEHTGLLSYEPGGMSFQFRALQHALAANHLVRTARFGFLSGVAHRAEWRDVVEDALCLATGSRRADLQARMHAAATKKPVIRELFGAAIA